MKIYKYLRKPKPEVSSFSLGFITLSDLYIAYRKAKREAYSDTNCAHGRKFAAYERHLSRNLQRLLKLIIKPETNWPEQPPFLGRATCIAKSVTPAPTPDEHFYDADPLKGWKQLHQKEKAHAEFRPVIDASVNFHVISVLWVLKVGHLYDACLDSKVALGNRLYRRRANKNADVGELNLDRQELFQPYFRAYRRWRESGFSAMKSELEQDRRIVGVTMDVKQFYHRIDASFLLHPQYLALSEIRLSSDEHLFTRQLIRAISTWNRQAALQFDCEPVGVPVGLTASSVIANVLLKEFDNEVIERLKPLHYGRYVDDIFLVLQDTDKFENKEQLMEWLAKRLRRISCYEEKTNDGAALRLQLDYARHTNLSFVGSKQKVFRLPGKLGLDLLSPIEEQIKRQNSEFRDLPVLPKTEAEMAARALLVTPDATLNADSLRKADAVVLRRAGFARLLSAVESYAQNLDGGEWEELRLNFYGLANRQIVTPIGFFSYARYLPRILALMSASDDIRAAIALVRSLGKVVRALQKTCQLPFETALTECTHSLGLRLLEAVLTTRTQDRLRVPVIPLLKVIQQSLMPSLAIPRTEKRVRIEGERLFLADWAKRPYGTAWLEERIRNQTHHRQPGATIAELLHLPTIRRLQRLAGIKEKPHWPGLCFPTRRIALSSLLAYVPRLLEDYPFLREVSLALRGSWMPFEIGLGLLPQEKGRPCLLTVPAPQRDKIHIAVTSIRTEDASWEAAALGKPALTLERYERMNSLINQVLRQPTRVSYLVLPECSLPRRWARNLSLKLSVHGISLIAGLEYRNVGGLLRNEAMVSLVTNFGSYCTNITLLQPKLAPAWGERSLLEEHSLKLSSSDECSLHLPVYRHGDLDFGVLICSDLTNLQHRKFFQGEIDCLFVPEWNQDVDTFAALVEASSHDLHAFVVQANNLRFGDSRIRAPHKENYARDVVRVRGGSDDYAVTGEIVPQELRAYQSTPAPSQEKTAPFKPYPVGFHISDRRRV